MKEDEESGIAEINAALRERLLRRMNRPGNYPTAVEGLTLIRRDGGDCGGRCFERPLAALWQTIGRCGKPPEDSARQFAVVALVADLDEPEQHPSGPQTARATT